MARRAGSPQPGRGATAGARLQLTGALWRAASSPEDRAPHMLALVLDGLRTRR
ncbi:hypothetical protein ACFUTV_23310 [Streptomyces sp. NPDC057298]|uniref:hypothetical protein n=1 Tax=Streptomyces sp. NPDC057298 TaxID=3346091 RepID=UPI00362711EB